MTTTPTADLDVQRRAECFVCKRRPWLIGIHLSPHTDKAGYVCPGSGEVAS